MAVRAVVFDFDGVVVDTEDVVLRSWSHVYSEHGVELPLDAWTQNIGTHGAFDERSYLEQALGRPLEWEPIDRMRRRRQDELIARLEILDGVRAWLDDADSLGIPVAIASSSPREWVEGFLRRLAIEDRFALVRCREDVDVVKPDPALYLSAAEGLGVDPAEAVAVEDSPNGIRAAKDAGMFCVAVPHALTRDLPLDRADLVVTSLAELPLPDLVERMRRYDRSGGRPC
ncbi:MAG TPA: HAD-IA family hydrolase [Actinomycetota bacterium]|nr:HAD-IA family hydrolase [Actinomycetota bacterium]